MRLLGPPLVMSAACTVRRRQCARPRTMQMYEPIMAGNASSFIFVMVILRSNQEEKKNKKGPTTKDRNRCVCFVAAATQKKDIGKEDLSRSVARV